PGQLPSALAELSEEAIGSLEALPSGFMHGACFPHCSYDGDDE
ncbi:MULTISPECIES: DUF5837 family cyanobactin class RiPP, partial [unclassified Limnospira]